MSEKHEQEWVYGLKPTQTGYQIKCLFSQDTVLERWKARQGEILWYFNIWGSQTEEKSLVQNILVN